MAEFCTELLDQVVDSIDERRDLWACAAVSHHFYRAASRHLYRHLYINLGDMDLGSRDRYCEVLNGIFEVKPFILSVVRSLRLMLPLAEKAWVDSPNQFRHATEFLLRLTHAKGLEELKVDRRVPTIFAEIARGRGKSMFSNHHGQYLLLALEALRCIPSLKNVGLVRIHNPPTVLVTGIPGQDAVVHLSLTSVTFDVEASEKVWILSDIPRDGPLTIHFERAAADWASILRVHTRLGSYNHADPPLHKLQHLRLTSVSLFRNYLHDVGMCIYGTGARKSRPLLHDMKIVNYAGRETGDAMMLTWAGYGDVNLVTAGRTLAQDCPQLQKIILDLDSNLGSKGGAMRCFLQASLTLYYAFRWSHFPR